MQERTVPIPQLLCLRLVGKFSLGEKEEEACFYAQVKAMSSHLSQLIYPSPESTSQTFRTIGGRGPLKSICTDNQSTAEETETLVLIQCLQVEASEGRDPLLGKTSKQASTSGMCWWNDLLLSLRVC